MLVEVGRPQYKIRNPFPFGRPSLTRAESAPFVLRETTNTESLNWTTRFKNVGAIVLALALCEDPEIKAQFARIGGKGFVGEIDPRAEIPIPLRKKNSELTEKFQVEFTALRRKNPDIDEQRIVQLLTHLHDTKINRIPLNDILIKPQLSKEDAIHILALETVLLTRGVKQEYTIQEQRVLKRAQELHNKGIFFINTNLNHKNAYHMILPVKAMGKDGTTQQQVDLCPHHTQKSDNTLSDVVKRVAQRQAVLRQIAQITMQPLIVGPSRNPYRKSLDKQTKHPSRASKPHPSTLHVGRNDELPPKKQTSRGVSVIRKLDTRGLYPNITQQKQMQSQEEVIIARAPKLLKSAVYTPIILPVISPVSQPTLQLRNVAQKPTSESIVQVVHARNNKQPSVRYRSSIGVESSTGYVTSGVAVGRETRKIVEQIKVGLSNEAYYYRPKRGPNSLPFDAQKSLSRTNTPLQNPSKERQTGTRIQAALEQVFSQKKVKMEEVETPLFTTQTENKTIKSKKLAESVIKEQGSFETRSNHRVQQTTTTKKSSLPAHGQNISTSIPQTKTYKQPRLSLGLSIDSENLRDTHSIKDAFNMALKSL